MSSIVSILIWIALGAVAGFLASLIMKSSLSLLWCIIIGIVGSVLGGFIAGLFGITASGIWSFVIAVGGACLLLLIVRMIRRA